MLPVGRIAATTAPSAINLSTSIWEPSSFQVPNNSPVNESLATVEAFATQATPSRRSQVT